MSEKTNKIIVNRFFEEVFNGRNLALIDDLISPAFTNHNASLKVQSAEGVKRAVAAQFAAFPDIHTTIEDMIVEGDKVVVRAKDSFTRQMDGKRVDLSWIEILRLEGGKIAEAWIEADMQAFADQFKQELEEKH